MNADFNALVAKFTEEAFDRMIADLTGPTLRDQIVLPKEFLAGDPIRVPILYSEVPDA